MTGWAELDRFVSTDPLDVGCDEAVRLLHVYADLAVVDPVAAARRHPGIAAHLRACGPCSEDLVGLLDAIDHQATDQQ